MPAVNLRAMVSNQLNGTANCKLTGIPDIVFYESLDDATDEMTAEFAAEQIRLRDLVPAPGLTAHLNDLAKNLRPRLIGAHEAKRTNNLGEGVKRGKAQAQGIAYFCVMCLETIGMWSA